MGIPNRDEVKGTVKKATGEAKRKVGDWTGDEETRAEGDVDRAEGEVQEKYGKVKREVGETIEEAGERIKRS